MKLETILYVKDGNVVTITLNRPEKRNAISRQLASELYQALDEAEKDDETRVIILTGGPKVFCAGADLAEQSARPGGLGKPDFPGPSAMDKLANMPKPTIAAIGGPCLAGGLELALSCDMRIASDTARIGDGHIKVGLLGPAGGTAKLPRLVGVGMGKELIFTGDLVDGQEACRIGLVNHVYSEDKFLYEALELAKRIAKNPPSVLRISKMAVDTGLMMSESDSLRFGHYCLAEVLASKEFKERIEGFLGKKKP